MVSIDPELEYLSREIIRQFRRPGAAIETKDWADEQLQEISDDVELVRRADGYEDFILDYILQERAKFRASEDELESLPYDEVRERKLCSCPNSECPLKEGRLPRAIRESDDFERGLRRFRQGHRGDPIVLRDARDEWYTVVSRVKSVERRVLSALSNNQIPGRETPDPEVDVDDDQDELEDEIEAELS